MEPVPALIVPFTQRLPANVEVAPVPLTSRNPARVEVAAELVAVMEGTVRDVYIVEVPDETKFAAPWMEKMLPGVPVPIPMREFAVSIERMGVVLVAVANENALILLVANVVVADWP